MKKVLFVGEHPLSTSGNGGMMLSVLSDVDTTKYEVNIFALESTAIDPSLLVSRPLPFSVISAMQPGDDFGSAKLLKTIQKSQIDAIVMVGIDVWVYSPIMEKIHELVSQKGIGWAAIFPYDLQYVRDDWVKWIRYFTHPCVYSRWGFEMLKPVVDKVKYFRPPLHVSQIWQPLSPKQKAHARTKIFQHATPDSVVFGMVGANQIRKDPQKLIKAFAMAKTMTAVDIRLFLHTTLKGMYDLKQYSMDCGLETNDVFTVRPGTWFTLSGLVELYNAMDCLVNCSLQEGLSWTLLESMLCGTPFIATKTTAQIELLEGAGYPVPCEEIAYVPLIGSEGNTWMDAKACKAEDLAEAICKVAESPELRKDLSEKGLIKGKEWLEGVSDINEVLIEATGYIDPVKVEDKIQAVLFAQHSAAGDVFMTTRCFKGIKERFGLPLHYMTSPQYMDILENNPYIDKIIPWDNKMGVKYQVVLNPHGDRIAPGHWGRNSNSILSDFYWKILDVEPDDFFIELKLPSETIIEENGTVDDWDHDPIVILHTTGGDSHYRIYKYMKDVHEGLYHQYTTVQLGGQNDYPAGCHIDLRGKLSFREAAWVMSKASMAVTVDSFISHLAGALGVSQVCLFGSGNSAVVQPKQIKGKLICRAIDYTRRCIGLGPCSASVRDCPATCTGLHNPKDILEDIKELELDNNNEIILRISK